jgi:tetratricopeptide (TPR) repeat protein
LEAPALADETYLSFQLKPLSPAESDELLGNLLDDVTPPPGLTGRLAERTNGNPLLMEEMVRMLLDREVIRPGPEGMEVAPQWVETVDQVPETVNGLILSRYDRLQPPLRRTLDAAAVLGHGFSQPLLLGVTGLAEGDLRAQLTTLEQTDFLRRATGPGLPVYAFRHWVMQEAIYQTILQKERRALHLRAAQVIQQMAESLAIDAAARVGDHLERGQSRQAISFLLEAARGAADRFANDEAIAYYRRLEALLEQHGGRQDEAVDVALGLTEVLTRTSQPEAARATLERARGLALGPPRPGYRLADVLYLLGQARARQGQHAEAYAAYEAAAAHLRGPSASGDQLATLARIEHRIGSVKLNQGQLADARAHADTALRLALADNDSEAAGTAHNLLAGSHMSAGQLPEAVASVLRALALREQLGDMWGSAASQGNLGGLYYKLGQWAQAEAYVRQAIFVQQEIGDYINMGASWSTLGQLLLDSGRFEEALHAFNQSLAALRGQELWPALAGRHLNRGQVWLRLGVAAWAVADLERSLEAASQINNDDLRARALASLAEARLIENDLPRARDELQQAELLSNTSGSLETRAEVLRARTILRRAEHDWERALDANHQALELFKQIGTRYEVARSQIESAEIQLARGPPAASPSTAASYRRCARRWRLFAN